MLLRLDCRCWAVLLPVGTLSTAAAGRCPALTCCASLLLLLLPLPPGGGKDLEEPLVVRPTSETIVNHMFAQVGVFWGFVGHWQGCAPRAGAANLGMRVACPVRSQRCSNHCRPSLHPPHCSGCKATATCRCC